jgi:hypothetical protein
MLLLTLTHRPPEFGKGSGVANLSWCARRYRPVSDPLAGFENRNGLFWFVIFSEVSKIDQQPLTQESILPNIDGLILVSWGFQMSSLQKRAENVIDPRLTAIANTTANLKTQMHELSGLRDRLRKAHLSVQRSGFPVVQRRGRRN